MHISTRIVILLLAFGFAAGAVIAQPVTGVWRGKVVRGSGLGRQTYKLEVKLVKNGDSITGTSYYYAAANNYFRYSVKGYFGKGESNINWWDDQLLESHTPGLKLGNANGLPMQSNAGYNCPGSGTMLLDGSSHPKAGGYAYELHLQKFEHPDFADEWDPIIETYFDGGADPHLIDSVGLIAFAKPAPPPAPKPVPPAPPPVPVKETTVYQPPKEIPKPVVKPVETKPEPPTKPVVVKQEPPAKPVMIPAVKPSAPVPEPVVVKVPPTIEEKFALRRNVLTNVIPVAGDTIEFKFYDNAEVDGDSISIFLNGRMLYTHIRLTDKAYTIKIPVAGLQAENDLVMVAENLGSIPPNTAYMEAWSGGIRYTARMESTELSSAMIKLKRQ